MLVLSYYHSLAFSFPTTARLGVRAVTARPPSACPCPITTLACPAASQHDTASPLAISHHITFLAFHTIFERFQTHCVHIRASFHSGGWVGYPRDGRDGRRRKTCIGCKDEYTAAGFPSCIYSREGCYCSRDAMEGVYILHTANDNHF